MKILRYLCGIAVVFSIVFTAFFGLKKIGEERSFASVDGYKGIITVWQIDSFEGGSGSRKKFLLDVAKTFEKENCGVLVSVVSHTKTSAEENMKKGIYPDLISYGNGVDIPVLKEMKKTVDWEKGEIFGKAYAYPWCRGGYVLITSNSDYDFTDGNVIKEVVFSEKEYTMPTLAFALEGFCAESFRCLTPDKAYSEFLNGKTEFLCGTQRDIVKLTNRGFEFKAFPLTQFNDLFQYVSLTATEQNKSVYAERFVSLLLSENVQKNLNKIDMFSAFYKTDNDSEILNLMQKTDGFLSLSPFLKPFEIDAVKVSVKDGLKAKGEIETKIKNLLL